MMHTSIRPDVSTWSHQRAPDGMCARCVCRCPISNSYYHKLSAKRVTYLARGAPNVDWLSDGRCCIRAGSFQCAPRDRHFIEYIAYICMYVHPNKDGDQCPSYICEINARNLDLINFQLSARFNSISAHFIYKFCEKSKPTLARDSPSQSDLVSLYNHNNVQNLAPKRFRFFGFPITSYKSSKCRPYIRPHTSNILYDLLWPSILVVVLLATTTTHANITLHGTCTISHRARAKWNAR